MRCLDKLPITPETLATRLTVVEQADHKNSEDHGKFFARIEAIEKSHAVVNTKLDTINAVVQEIKGDVKALSDKPAKRWETVVTEILKWVAVAATAYFLSVK